VTPLSLGAKAIEFELIGVDDQKHKLADYADNEVVIVMFSCNHCPYVRAWEDRMVQIQSDYAGKGVQFVAINANDTVSHPDDDLSAMKQRAQEKNFNFPYLRDDTQETAKAYGAERTPELFVFDNGGTLRYHGAIDDNYEDPDSVKENYLRAALDAVLEGKAPANAATPPVGCTIKWKN
jgi:peroxiredoxin